MTRGRALLLAAAGSGAAVTVAAGLAQAAQHSYAHLQVGAAGPTTEPVWALTLLAACLGTLVAARLALCAAAVTCALLAPLLGAPGAAARWVAIATSPRTLRPTLALVLAGSVTMAVAAPALAASHHPGARAETVRSTSKAISTAASTGRTAASVDAAGPTLPAPGWLPAPRRPAASFGERSGRALPLVSSGGGSSDSTRRPAAGVDSEVVVRRGDTLWHLAARTLGAGATDAEIIAEWPRWWQANRATIGANPHLLLPGTRLRPP